MFSADWHIKLGQKDVPIEWAKNRFYGLFSQIHALEKEVDIHIIGGDIFDKTPSMEELELFFDFVSDCSIPTYIYDGNHEATKKGKTFLSNLGKAVKRINRKVEIIDDYATIHNIDFIPYCRLKEYNPADIDFHSKILCTHVRGEIPPHVKPEVNLDIFNRWEVVLAGDLHSYDNCQRNILYPGSPVTTSFHRNHVDTGVILLSTSDLSHRWVKLNLPQLIRKTIKAGEEMVPGEYDHVVYEVEGDMAELGTVEDNALISKKITKRVVDTALILDPDMTIEEEVMEYLQYILSLPENTAKEVLSEFNAHANKIN